MKNGKIVYSGTTEAAQEWFDEQGYDFPDDENPADTLMVRERAAPVGRTVVECWRYALHDALTHLFLGHHHWRRRAILHRPLYP